MLQPDRLAERRARKAAELARATQTARRERDQAAGASEALDEAHQFFRGLRMLALDRLAQAEALLAQAEHAESNERGMPAD